MDGKVTRARELRRESTYPEKICWELLRAHRMEGIKFRIWAAVEAVLGKRA